MGKAIIIPDVSFASANLGKVTLTEEIPLRAISIVAPISFVGITLNTIRIIYNPLNTSQRGVTWSVTRGIAYATINATSGALTVLPGASANNVTIKATSTADSSITAEATIAVTYRSSEQTLWDEALADSDFGQYMSGLTKKYELSAPRTYNGQQTTGDAITQPMTSLGNYAILFEATFGTNPVTSVLAPCVYTRVSDNANFSKEFTREGGPGWAADTKFVSQHPVYPGVTDGNRYKILIFFNRTTGTLYVKNLTTGQMYNGTNFVGGGTLREEFYLGGGASNVNNFTGTIHQFYIGA